MDSATSSTISEGSRQTDAVDLLKPHSPEKQEDIKAGLPIGTTGRTPSHSLLSTSPNNPTSSRKSRFADAGTVGGNVGRASLSMPPPATKPSSIYRPSTARLPSNLVNSAGAGEPGSGIEGTKDIEYPSDGGASLDLQRTASVPGLKNDAIVEPHSPSNISDSGLKPPTFGLNKPGERLSLSSLYSLGSAIYDKATGQSSTPASAASSNAGSIKSSSLEQHTPMPLSPPLSGSSKSEAVSTPTTATDPISVVANAQNTHQSLAPQRQPKDKPSSQSSTPNKPLDSWNSGPISRPSVSRRSRSKSKTPRHPSGSTVASSAASPSSSDRFKPPLGRVGVCALDVKARSKASRNILTRIQGAGEFDVIIFGDKVILDEDVENWPICDYLISFFSDGFPLDKAILYQNLRKPFCVNDLQMQKILWDRRICLRILDSMGVPTPRRVEVNRDRGPVFESKSLAEHVFSISGVKLEGSEDGTGGGTPITQSVELIDDGDTLVVDGVPLRKPFVEKPISGENHNIHIYFPRDHKGGGGGRRLFRKIGNKSSEWDEKLIVPRSLTENDSSYIYEQFLHVDNAEDIKAYTVGPEYCHAETRTSPVVDGLVRRNTHGKEIRYICTLSSEEMAIARKVANGFGQRICGFDMLRVNKRSYVIDVNGWSFVKDNKDYYDQCASKLKQMFVAEKQRRDGVTPVAEPAREAPSDERTQEETHTDHGIPHRRSAHGHRSALKDLMKSPSMSKLHKARHPYAATDGDTANMPLSSPPTFENEQRPAVHPHIADGSERLPSPVAIPPPPTLSPPQNPATKEQSVSDSAPQPAAKHSWKLKGMVSVIRHADRTPKQKFKFTFHTQPFIELLKGHQEEVLLKGEAALNSVMDAVKIAMKQKIEDPEKLQLLRTSLARKGAWTGTKVQIKPMFRKKKAEEMPQLAQSSTPDTSEEYPSETNQGPIGYQSPLSRPQTRSDSVTDTTLSRYSAAENDLVFEKLQLIVKWGGEPTHSARYQSQDLGENMRGDLLLMNKEVLEDVHVYTSSEPRVSTSAQIWASSFLDQHDIPESSIIVRKDLLDDSNAAKDVMDKVKKKLKVLLREGHKPDPQFAWPPNTPEPSTIVKKVAELMRFHRKVMRYNFKKLNGGAAASLNAINTAERAENNVQSATGGVLAQAQSTASIQARWCCGEDPELFKERWEKLFSEFCDSEKVDPSKISELYDTMKFDALHNRQFLEWVFTPSSAMPEGEIAGTASSAVEPSAKMKHSTSTHSLGKQERKSGPNDKQHDRESDKNNPNLAHRMGLRRKSAMNPTSPQPEASKESQESYFKLYSGTGGTTKAKLDVRLESLRELYKLAKVLFDFICPQEYGISDEEKLEIGLLTSLPLLKEIVHDLEDVQASDDAKSFIYFTKESHIYTLLNCILEGGIKTKIARNAIPELDYLSHITFELYESEDQDADTFTYSIRIAITPGCHTIDPLDVQLDSKHEIGCAPRRSLTAHQDWKEVIETLRGKFGTVRLPKSFLAINVSDSHTTAASGSSSSIDEKEIGGEEQKDVVEVKDGDKDGGEKVSDDGPPGEAHDWAIAGATGTQIAESVEGDDGENVADDVHFG